MPLQPLSTEHSTRLALLRFPLIVGVVFVHAYGTTMNVADVRVGASEHRGLNEFIQNFISNGLARTAVPLFFLVSGYLLFATRKWSLQAYFDKLRSRTRTLLIPFLFWSLLTVGVLLFAQSLVSLRGYFSGGHTSMAGFEWRDYIDAIFGIGRMPIAYQFWFIRDLMVLVIFSPLIWFLNKKSPHVFLLAMGVAWIFNLEIPFFPDMESIFYFSLGSFFAVRSLNLFFCDAHAKVLLVMYFIILVFSTLNKDAASYPYLYKFGIVLGSMAILGGTKKLMGLPRVKDAVLSLGVASFFVYATHEPLLTALKKISYAMLRPATETSQLALYFFAPIATLLITSSLFFVTRRFFPSAVSVVTGGR